MWCHARSRPGDPSLSPALVRPMRFEEPSGPRQVTGHPTRSVAMPRFLRLFSPATPPSSAKACVTATQERWHDNVTVLRESPQSPQCGPRPKATLGSQPHTPNEPQFAGIGKEWSSRKEDFTKGPANTNSSE